MNRAVSVAIVVLVIGTAFAIAYHSGILEEEKSSMSIHLFPSSEIIEKWQSVFFTNNTTGGTLPYKYSYALMLNGTSTSFGYYRTSNDVTFNAVGSWKIYLNVTDSQGKTASSSSTVTVNSPQLGPYVVLSAYANNGTSISPIMSNLTADISVWVPDVNGSEKTINLNTSSVQWNQHISLSSNLTEVVNAWKSLNGNEKDESTMSLIVTYTSVNGTNMNIFEYYTDISFNPLSPTLSSQSFPVNLTLNLMHPFTTIPLPLNSTLTGTRHPEDYGVVWTKTLAYTGYYPVNLINATEEPNNELLTLAWTTTSASAKIEFDGITSINGNFLTSANGYLTTTNFTTGDFAALAGNSGFYDFTSLVDTTMTWAFGKEYFYVPYGSQGQKLIVMTNLTDLKVQYVGSNQVLKEGLPYGTAQASNGTTYGNITFDEEWARAISYAFSYQHDQHSYNLSITAGHLAPPVYNFDIQSSSNLSAIFNTFIDANVSPVTISPAGLIFAVMVAGASDFQGGVATSTLAAIQYISELMGAPDSDVNLAASFIMLDYPNIPMQEMGLTNQIINSANNTSSIDVFFYDTGGSTFFCSNSGMTSFVARIPFEEVTS